MARPFFAPWASKDKPKTQEASRLDFGGPFAQPAGSRSFAPFHACSLLSRLTRRRPDLEEEIAGLKETAERLAEEARELAGEVAL
jgi:hypothetical protein